MKLHLPFYVYITHLFTNKITFLKINIGCVPHNHTKLVPLNEIIIRYKLRLSHLLYIVAKLRTGGGAFKYGL